MPVWNTGIAPYHQSRKDLDQWLTTQWTCSFWHDKGVRSSTSCATAAPAIELGDHLLAGAGVFRRGRLGLGDRPLDGAAVRPGGDAGPAEVAGVHVDLPGADFGADPGDGVGDLLDVGERGARIAGQR